jgi:hypothetical protein
MSETTLQRHSGRSAALRLLRKAGITREDVAESLDVPPTSISRWLNGHRRCHAGALWWNVVCLAGEDPVEINDTPTEKLTESEREAVILAYKVVRECERAWQREHPTSKLKPSRDGRPGARRP